MSLTIDDTDADHLAHRVATLTGESVAEAVRTSLRERLERLERARSEERLIEDVRAISREFRRHLRQPFTSADHGDLLHDADGLPG